VAADGNEVNGSANEDEAVPYSVCERYDAVTLEEHDTNDVNDSASCQLVQSRHLLLHQTTANIIGAKLHYTDTGYGHVVGPTTPPTDKLITILKLVVQQICHIAMPEPNNRIIDIWNNCLSAYQVHLRSVSAFKRSLADLVF